MQLLELPPEILALIVRECVRFKSLRKSIYTSSALTCTCWTLYQEMQHHLKHLNKRIKKTGCLRVKNLRQACVYFRKPDMRESSRKVHVISLTNSDAEFVPDYSTISRQEYNQQFYYCSKTQRLCFRDGARSTDHVYYWVETDPDMFQYSVPNARLTDDPNMYVKFYSKRRYLFLRGGERQGEGQLLTFHLTPWEDEVVVISDLYNFYQKRFPTQAFELKTLPRVGVFCERCNYEILNCSKIKKVEQVHSWARKSALELSNKLLQASSRLSPEQYIKLIRHVQDSAFDYAFNKYSITL